MKRVWIVLLTILGLLSLLGLAFLIYLIPAPEKEQSCYGAYTNVDRVIDGDTFVMNSGDKIRLLCVDTPEKAQEGYEEAKDFLDNLIMCKDVVLTSSNYGGNDTDKYGRLLRWIYIENESSDSGELILINKYILEEGYGDLLVIPPETCNEVAD